MAEPPRELSAEEFAAQLFGRGPVEERRDVAEPEEPQDAPAPQPPQSSDDEPTVEQEHGGRAPDLVAHLQAEAQKRNALTQHLLAPREVPQPTGEGALAHARDKREQQRDLVELHGDAEQLPAVRPMPELSSPDYSQGPEPSGEPRPPEFRPEGADE